MANDLGGDDVLRRNHSRRTFATPDYELAYSATAVATSSVNAVPPISIAHRWTREENVNVQTRRLVSEKPANARVRGIALKKISGGLY